jgi:nifR3 family TIM-barrel protein
MLSVKSLTLDGPLVLAPMAGYSDSVFRRIVRRHGAALTVTELISAEGIVRMNRNTRKLLRFADDERPLGIQIFGKNPEVMGEAARVVESLGPDLIDINMGCCAQKVCHHGMGAALLKDPAALGRIAESVVKSVSLPVSAKIRVGWDLSTRNYREVVTALEDAGVDFITVHGRTRSQMYTGEADWDIIREIASVSRLPIVGNGDIASHAEALARLEDSGCAAVMIGRGAVGNPWIFSGAAPSFTEIVAQAKEHLLMMEECYGDYGIILTRKHLVKYLHGFHNASKVRVALLRSTDMGEIFAILDALRDDIEHSNMI